MYPNTLRGALAGFMISLCSPAQAWWDAGHMQIAYVAYKRLDAPVRDKVDALLRRNPDYAKWTAGIADANIARLHAFIRASVWADDIKTREYAYTRDRVTDPTAGQNIGYPDRNQHAYWHYKDINWSPDRTALPSADPVDAVTQMKLMVAALPASSGASDDVRSYDLVWLLHLVGDVHQPLHAVGRYTQAIQNGDAGGNAETVIPATGERIKLHAYWDRMFGGYSSVYGAMFDADAEGGLAHVPIDTAVAGVADPRAWVDESFELAKKFAYAAPIPLDKSDAMLTRDYETNARNVALERAALAAARLSNLISAALQ